MVEEQNMDFYYQQFLGKATKMIENFSQLAAQWNEFSSLSKMMRQNLSESSRVLHQFHNEIWEILDSKDKNSIDHQKIINLVDLISQVKMLEELDMFKEDYSKEFDNSLSLAGSAVQECNNLTYSLQESFDNFRTMLEMDAHSRADELHGINRKILEAQEEERKRISRDIHDGPAQLLASLSMEMDNLTDLIAEDSYEARSFVEEIKGKLRNSLEEVRRCIFNLRPMTLDDLGLTDTVKRYVQELQKGSFPCRIFCGINGIIREISKHQEEAIFRVIQESVNNCRKHSQCKNLWIVMNFSEKNLEVIVKDDGIGFDFEKINREYSNSSSLGLVSMGERMNLICAKLQVETEPEKGTCIRVNLDLGEKE